MIGCNENLKKKKKMEKNLLKSEKKITKTDRWKKFSMFHFFRKRTVQNEAFLCTWSKKWTDQNHFLPLMVSSSF